MSLSRVSVIAIVLICISNSQAVQPKGVTVSSEEINPAALLQQADSTFQLHDYKTALAQYQAAADRARGEFNRSVEAEALAQMARMHLVLGDKDAGRDWLKKAESRAVESDPMAWSRYLSVRGRFEWKDNDLKSARQTFRDMYAFCTANSLWGRAVDAANMIAIVAESPAEQIEWGRRGIETAEANGVESWLGPLWNNLAGTYFDGKQYDSALECYLKAREYHWQYSGEVAKLFADYHVGMTCRLLGKYDDAAKWLRPVLAWAERLDNHSAIGQACEDLGEIEAAQGRTTSALEFLRRARDEYKLEGFDQSSPEIWTQINERIRALEK